MSTKDVFHPGDSLPRLLSEHADESDSGKARGRADISSRILKGCIFAAVASLIAMLLVESPVALFAKVIGFSMIDKSALRLGADRPMPTVRSTAVAQVLAPTATDAPTQVRPREIPTTPSADIETSLVDASALQPGADRSMPTIRSATDAGAALPPTAREAPTYNDIAAASETTVQDRTESNEPSSEALFEEFQAWVARKDVEAQVAPSQPAQDATPKTTRNNPAQVAKNTLAPVRPIQRHRHVGPSHHAQAEIRPVQKSRRAIPREQQARAQVTPAQGDRAQDQALQNPQTPSFLQTLGWHN